MRPGPYVAGALALVALTLVDAGPSFGWFELPADTALPLGVGKLAALLFLVTRFLSDRGAPRALVVLLAAAGLGIGTVSIVVLGQGPNVELVQTGVPAGQALYGQHCATCHGHGGQGTHRGPSLVDGVWLHGGTETDIAVTIAAGVPGTSMQAWGPEIGEEYAPLLAAYVLSLETAHAPD